MMNTPKLYFKKTHLGTGLSFEDWFSMRNMADYDTMPIQYIEQNANQRILKWNECLKDKWVYELLEWRVE